MAADVVVNPRVTTDRSVDTSSVKAMVDSLVKPGMSDQDKALAVYNFVRRTMFHYRYLTEYAGGGTMDLINSVGYCLCTPTAGTQARLFSEAGLNGHVLTTLGHGSVCVEWDGKWHWMDAFLGGCVWDKDRKTIASLEEIVADPSLLKRDKPGPAPLFACGAALYDDAIRWEPNNKKYHAECGPDDTDWAARSNPGKHQPMVWNDVSSLDITLRPGERYTREWDHVPGMFFLFKTEEKFAPPHHFCGVEAEQRDTVNWPYWKPYVKDIESTDARTGKKVTVKTGRYWANGHLTWQPRFDSAEVLKQFARAENAAVKDGAIVPADPSRLAVLEWRTKLPYMLQGGQLSVTGESVSVSVWVSPKRSDKSPKTQPDAGFSPLELREESKSLSADIRPHFAKPNLMGSREYVLRFELNGKDARLAGLSLDTVFQHNMYALPQLMPGKNEVKVAVANPDALKAAKFVVEFAWDSPEGRLKTDERVIDKSPFTFSIDIPEGKDLPRMRRLAMSNKG
ncbi:MAG: hypothetical protein PHU85_06550 [Phycisphaerae bacterium]|nr:hypothetical protein [Phycisphaerae bacterium]